MRILVTPGEGCDDGNNLADDGCQSFCQPCPETAFPLVRATSKTVLGWGEHADVTWVVGDLGSVSSLSGSQHFATFAGAIEAPLSPPPGEGEFYVFRFDCPGSTWSSGGPGESGDRDALLP